MSPHRTGDRWADGRGAGPDQESFQRLATAELPALYWLARRLVRDGAEDLVQEALLRAYRSYGTLRQDTRPGRGSRASWSMCSATSSAARPRSPEELPVDQVEDFSLYQTHRAGPAALFRHPAPRLPAGVRQGGSSGRCCCACLSCTGPRWCCGTWTGSPPRRSPACSMFPWGRSWPGCIGAASGSNKSYGRMPRRPDSSSGDSAMTVKPGVIPCSEAVRQLGTTWTAVTPEDQGEGGAAPVVLPQLLRGAGVRHAAARVPGLPERRGAPLTRQARLERFLADL